MERPDNRIEGFHLSNSNSSHNVNGSTGRGSLPSNSDASVAAGTWDVEEDHLLSYFLSGDHAEGNPSNFSSTVDADKGNSSDSPVPINTSISAGNIDHLPSALASRGPSQSSGNHIRFAKDVTNSANLSRGTQPPSTPAVHFYAGRSSVSKGTSSNQHNNSHSVSPQLMHTKHQLQHLQLSSAPSSSPLSSVAAALAQGATPGQVMQVHQQFQSQVKDVPTPPNLHLTGMSPISPAAVIGAGHETMMLPPPPRFPSGRASTTISSSQNMSQQKVVGHQWHINQQNAVHGSMESTQGTLENTSQQISPQHMEWLKQMNSIASIASQSTSALGQGSIIAQPATVNATSQHSQPQPQSYPNPFQPSLLPLATAESTTTHNQQPQILNSTFQKSNADILPSAPVCNIITQLQQTMSKQNGDSNATESAEKRARRLARNRESARQSRRRKKDLLLKLGAKVSKLHTEIETERRSQLASMEKEFGRDRERIIQQMFQDLNSSQKGQHMDLAVAQQLASLIHSGGPNCTPRRATAAFQYNALRQLILPYYRQHFLWLSLKDEAFFTTAKDRRSKTNKGSGRVSSKQVGEELFASNKNSFKSGTGGKFAVNCDANDINQVWPLLCYELGVSVDQEERFMQSFRRIRDDKNIPKIRSEIAVATTMVSNLKNGILFQCHSSAHRNELALLQVLSPSQSIKFLKWYCLNKDRCWKLLGKRFNNVVGGERTSNELINSSLKPLSHPERINRGSNLAGANPNDRSLNDVCEQLTEALKIQKCEGF